MGIDEALTLIEYALKQKTEELVFQRWISDIHFQQMGFDEFKNSMKPVRIKDEKEILEDVESILSLF